MDRVFQSHRLVKVVFLVAFLFVAFSKSTLFAVPQSGESAAVSDFVQYRDPNTGLPKTISGKIADLTKTTLLIVDRKKREKKVSRASIVQFQVNSNPSFTAAKQAALNGDFTFAVKSFQEVIDKKSNPAWLKRLARINKIQCDFVNERESRAIAEFLSLAKQQPGDIPWDAIPLCWVNDPLQNTRVRLTLQNLFIKRSTKSDPVAALVACSFGLNFPKYRQTSVRLLTRLRDSKEKLKESKVASDLAFFQLLRIDLGVEKQQLKSYMDQVSRMPKGVRSGPRLVLGQRMGRMGLQKQACSQFLLVASVDRMQHSLVLLGLTDAYYTLKKLKDPQAEAVAKWLIRRFPDSVQGRSLVSSN